MLKIYNFICACDFFLLLLHDFLRIVRTCVGAMKIKGLNILLMSLLLVVPMVAQDSLSVDSITPFDVLPMADETPAPKKSTIDARVEYTSQDSLVMTGKGIAHM